MNSTRNTWSWGLLLLGGLLWALPAAAQASGSRCESDCAIKSSGPMKACMNTCPHSGSAKDMRATGGYQGCAARCSSQFQERFKTCKKKCPDSKKTPRQ